MTNQKSEGFWDAMVFADRNHGFILGDPVRGSFELLETIDAGATWTRIFRQELKSLPDNEGAFAASNSSLAITPSGTIFIGTGGKRGARIFRIHNGRVDVRWVPVGSHTETGGVFSIAFRDNRHGFAVGGDFKDPERGIQAAIFTADGGDHWVLCDRPPSGYRSAAAWDKASKRWIAVGPNGTDASANGRDWMRQSSTGWNALSLPWAVGAEGSIGALR
jgi:photosystem II stability/assembly factor-like uncharacterized protein